MIQIGINILINLDNQGRGDFLDESRIEKSSSRPLENPSFDINNSGNKGGGLDPIKKLRNNVKNKVNDILNNGEKIMSFNNLQSLQNQIDCCNNFCEGIDTWHKLNKKAIDDLRVAINSAIFSNTLNDFRQTMEHHWKYFDELTRDAIFLLGNHKSGFQTQAILANNAIEKLGGKAQLNNHIQGGLADNVRKL